MSVRKFSRTDFMNLSRERRGDWYRITNAKEEVADIYIYGHIGWEVTATDFIRDLREVTANKIDVHIATNGGDVFEGVAILNALRGHKAEITTIVDSQALSAGSFIMQAGDIRKMMPNSQVMIHDALVGFSYAEGNAQDMREFAKEVLELADMLDFQSDNIAAVYAERAGGTKEEWRAVMKQEKWYSAEEAVEAGLADEVVPLKAKAEKAVAPTAEFDAEQFQKMMEGAFK